MQDAFSSIANGTTQNGIVKCATLLLGWLRKSNVLENIQFPQPEPVDRYIHPIAPNIYTHTCARKLTHWPRICGIYTRNLIYARDCATISTDKVNPVCEFDAYARHADGARWQRHTFLPCAVRTSNANATRNGANVCDFTHPHTPAHKHYLYSRRLLRSHQHRHTAFWRRRRQRRCVGSRAAASMLLCCATSVPSRRHCCHSVAVAIACAIVDRWGYTMI